MPSLISTESYERRLKKFIKKHPNLKETYLRTLQLLEVDPFHPSLRTQKLKEALKSFHAVSLNLQYRIVLHFVLKNDQIILIDIGSHDAVY